jgi:hypothetical protein
MSEPRVRPAPAWARSSPDREGMAKTTEQIPQDVQERGGS